LDARLTPNATGIRRRARVRPETIARARRRIHRPHTVRGGEATDADVPVGLRRAPFSGR
jgi:hypothetical protein